MFTFRKTKQNKTVREYLVCVFKQSFSDFKQYFTYFYILFYPHVFSQIFSNNNFQFLNTCTKQTLINSKKNTHTQTHTVRRKEIVILCDPPKLLATSHQLCFQVHIALTLVLFFIIYWWFFVTINFVLVCVIDLLYNKS